MPISTGFLDTMANGIPFQLTTTNTLIHNKASGSEIEEIYLDAHTIGNSIISLSFNSVQRMFVSLPANAPPTRLLAGHRIGLGTQIQARVTSAVYNTRLTGHRVIIPATSGIEARLLANDSLGRGVTMNTGNQTLHTSTNTPGESDEVFLHFSNVFSVPRTIEISINNTPIHRLSIAGRSVQNAGLLGIKLAGGATVQARCVEVSGQTHAFGYVNRLSV